VIANKSRKTLGVLLSSAAVILVLGLLGGCSGESKEKVAPKKGPYYLSIGDSYAAGFRPAVDGHDAENSTDGFAFKIASQTGLTLMNYACSGITAVDYVEGAPCVPTARPVGGPEPTDSSEGDAVLAWLDKHGDEVELVTVILGGNDVQGCIEAADWRTCSKSEMKRVQVTLDQLLSGIRARVGDSVPIIGLNYPNVLLANPALSPVPDGDATESIEFFNEIINPALKETYEKHGVKTADVTAAFGGNLPADDMVDSEEFGTIPRRAEQICQLTYYCQLRDVHPTNEGHRRIAELVLKVNQKQS